MGEENEFITSVTKGGVVQSVEVRRKEEVSEC